MKFGSTEFLFVFLPVFLAVYYLAPEKMRNGLLFLGGIAFYALGFHDSFWQTGLLLVLITWTYIRSICLGKHPGNRIPAGDLLLLAGILAFFKLYHGGRHLAPGMSFFLFQMAAYLIEVCRHTIPCEQGLVYYGGQILLFPKLLSGPLCDPRDLHRQFWGRGYLPEEFREGLQQLILGLAMKTVLADRLGGLWSQAGVIGYESISPIFAWLALLCWSLRLYLDFFAYSTMAKGLGLMLGFRLPRNFTDPYCAKSVSEFYRRWHASLGLWFRNYIYIPLGGSRRGTLRTLLNLAVVWLITGLWHEIGWGYLLWAGILLFFIILERLWLGRYLSRSRILCHVYVPFVIVLSWVPFALVDPPQILLFFTRLFGFGPAAINPKDFLFWGKEYLPLILGGIALCTPWPEKLWKKIRNHPAADIGLFFLFWTAVYFLSTGSQDPFLYFQF